MTKKRVVVTGLGLVSPTGNTVADAWENVRNGVSGISAIDTFDVSAFSTQFAGVIRNFDIGQYLEPKEARKCDPFIHYGVAACEQAIADSGFSADSGDPTRVGVYM
ncbi:MAG: beta-ketoacyl synthase N-terminal-like domain-containing protein, partial [Gammaproteobacteria bacterium]|nr:beta-ketoacyl synthase N-terminal-like domain-containing protein [Gammaproteobacteria bacterium]